MPITGFHSEWLTIGHHRVYLECRASFPTDDMRFLTAVACRTCDTQSEGRARVIGMFFDDKAGAWTLTVASDNPEHAVLETVIERVIHTMLNADNCRVETIIVPTGDRESDHYNHTEHLSVAAARTSDRWRHADQTYLASVRAPR